MMQHLFHNFRNWPFDKQLTFYFPAVMIFLACLSGSILHFEPMENKAVLTGASIFLTLIIWARYYLQGHTINARVEWFLREFWPIPAILLGYLTMRLFRLELAVEYFSLVQQDDLMIRLDEQIFGQPVPLYMQHWISDGFSLWMETAYLHFYYLLPIGSMFYFFWRAEHDRFLQLRKGIIYTLAGGFSCYFILPVEGPVSYIADQFTVPLVANHAIVYDAVNSFRYAYDCFPSLHTAIPWMTLFISWSWHGHTMRLVLLAMTLSITLSTMYLRYHYGFDVIAGFCWALLISVVVKYQVSKETQGSVATAC